MGGGWACRLHRRLWVWHLGGFGLPINDHSSNSDHYICIYYNTSAPMGMGREIFTISVPIGSQVWDQLQAWRQDANANVSANVCAAIQSDMDNVNRGNALNKRHEFLGRELREMNRECGCRGLTFDQWMDFFGEWKVE